jgi:hypothetical protein
VVTAIIEATKVAENFMVSIEIPQQRFVDAFGSTMSGGEEMERSSVRENFSELQVALFGEHIFAAWTESKSCLFISLLDVC